MPPITLAELCGSGRGTLFGNWDISKEIREGMSLILSSCIDMSVTASFYGLEALAIWPGYARRVVYLIVRN